MAVLLENLALVVAARVGEPIAPVILTVPNQDAVALSVNKGSNEPVALSVSEGSNEGLRQENLLLGQNA